MIRMMGTARSPHMTLQTCGFVLLRSDACTKGAVPVLSCCTAARGQQRARVHVTSTNVSNRKIMHVTTTFLNAPNDNLRSSS
jgi:hypothetical protein